MKTQVKPTPPVSNIASAPTPAYGDDLADLVATTETSYPEDTPLGSQLDRAVTAFRRAYAAYQSFYRMYDHVDAVLKGHKTARPPAFPVLAHTAPFDGHGSVACQTDLREMLERSPEQLQQFLTILIAHHHGHVTAAVNTMRALTEALAKDFNNDDGQPAGKK